MDKGIFAAPCRQYHITSGCLEETPLSAIVWSGIILCSSKFIHLQITSFPYPQHGAPYLPCLLRYDYFRIWKQEHSKFQACKCAKTKPPKKKFSPYRKNPIRGTYCGGGCSTKGSPKARFVMKQFRCVPAKVDHRRKNETQQYSVQPVCNMIPAPACC